ncbi:MAG: ABC transporter ATP-binding protein [Desulfobacteraceae bacterium]|nr:ABC transporter ATP-binding protein [Desulfobacteraceae bacterium]
MNILELKGLRKQFGGLVAVNDVDLGLEEGEIRGLIGPNGSGKTTLFNLISGFLQPTKGKVIWRGKDITGKPVHSIVKEGVVRTFQLTTLLKDMTALQNVVIGCHLHVEMGLLKQVFGAARKREKEKALVERAVSLLKTMGIESVKDDPAGALPHGYQRALNLVIALATEPKLLLLDEPTTGMNPVETKEFMDRIKMLRDERSITIILVEHDMKAVMSNCEKITVMDFGKKIAEGSPEEISKNEEVIEAYLGR